MSPKAPSRRGASPPPAPRARLRRRAALLAALWLLGAAPAHASDSAVGRVEARPFTTQLVMFDANAISPSFGWQPSPGGLRGSFQAVRHFPEPRCLVFHCFGVISSKAVWELRGLVPGRAYRVRAWVPRTACFNRWIALPFRAPELVCRRVSPAARYVVWRRGVAPRTRWIDASRDIPPYCPRGAWIPLSTVGTGGTDRLVVSMEFTAADGAGAADVIEATLAGAAPDDPCPSPSGGGGRSLVL